MIPACSFRAAAGIGKKSDLRFVFRVIKLNESQLEQLERSLEQRYNQLVQLGAGAVVIDLEVTPT